MMKLPRFILMLVTVFFLAGTASTAVATGQYPEGADYLVSGNSAGHSGTAGNGIPRVQHVVNVSEPNIYWLFGAAAFFGLTIAAIARRERDTN